MINVSSNFKQAMKKPVKELDAYINTDTESIKSADDLLSFKISCDTGMCKTAMRKLEAKIVGDHDLVGKWVNVGFGVRIDNNFEYMDYGSFLITEITSTKDTGVTQVVGYDKMISTMVEYTPLEVTYPIGLYNYTVALCRVCGLEVANQSFINNNWQVTQDLWENINGITYRDILQQIAQATGSTCIIDSNNNVCFKYITTTGEELTYDNMLKLKLEPMYGEINKVILGRDPVIGEDVFMQDSASIETNGLTEFRIDNNQIVDKSRNTAIIPIYNTLHGIYYYPFETTTEGLGWYEIGDSFNIVNDLGTSHKCVLFNFSISIDGGIKEILKATAETKTESQYQYATPMGKRIKNTEIIVNKQEGYIDQLVSDMYDEEGIVHDNFTRVYQDIQNIINSVQNSGGANLLKNSVMFAYDNNGNPNEWTVTGAGTLLINSSAESLTNGCLSGNIFTLNNKTVKQRVYVKANNDEENKTYYTFSTRIKKNTTGTCYVKIYNDNEEYRIDLASGESAFYKDYVLQELLPTSGYYDIEFYGSADSDATFTDNMFAVGEYKSQWQQASGEIMNTQVNINVDGVLVKSSVYAGNYTIMSPLEFAGYSNKNGVITKVFTLNDDTTEVDKLKATNGITMPPIKIVPVKTGSLQGWAFVPSTEV